MPHGGPADIVRPMRCPSCASVESRVVDTRPADDGATIRRRRQCELCGHRFTTFERIEEQPLMVIKRDGRRQGFDRTKVEVGLRSACKGRPVDEEALSALVGRLEDALRLRGEEVESAVIGALVLEELRPLDGVAAVRFASVYKAFESAEDFERELLLLEARQPVEPPAADEGDEPDAAP
jgi:transcriptional repressor NrdR